MKFRCCRRMGGASRKHDKPLIIKESSPFTRSNNPMRAHNGVSNKRFERVDSCYKSDSLFRSDSFHPLGSPSISTFGTFAVIDPPLQSMPIINNVSSSSEALIESPAAETTTEAALIPITFTESRPSYVSRLLRDSATPSVTGSSVSLVPGPSLSYSTDTLASTQSIKPVYIIPPEVEQVDIRHVPQPLRKQSVPARPDPASPQPMRRLTSVSTSRLDSLSSVGSGGSVSTGRPSLVENQLAEEARTIDLETSLTESSTTLLSQHSDSRAGIPSFQKVPSPMTSTGREDMSHRALPPTPLQATPTRTLPLKRHHSPLVSAELLAVEESSLDMPDSRHPRKFNSWTLPTKRRGLLPETPPTGVYHRVQSPTSESSPPSGDIPPPRPPRTLIDPTRVMDFTAMARGPVDHVRNPRDHVMSEPKADPTLCTNCGREIIAEPFYICVLEPPTVEPAIIAATDAVDTSLVSEEEAPLISDPTCSDSEINDPISDDSEIRSSGSISNNPISNDSEIRSSDPISDDSEVRSSGPISDDSDVESSAETATPPGSPMSTSPEEEIKPGSAICMNCISKEGPIYHELEPGEIEAILSNTPPPIPARENPPERSPVYERIASVKRKLTLKLSTGSRVVTRVSLDGAYIIKASRPRRLRRKQSSTDHEQLSTDLDTPTSYYHRADELHSKLTLPSELDPADHMTCRPHPPLRLMRHQQSSSHDYESLPGSIDLGKRRGSHDYAFIGPAPSMESLDERCSSPPYAPPTGSRATLMRIDSQGYASVVIPDHHPNEEACQISSCSFHSSTDALAMPQDYEVPVITKTVKPPPVFKKPLTRQRAVITLNSDRDIPGELPGEASEARLVSPDPDQGSMESVNEQVSVTDEVFDSGIENSNEGFEIISPSAQPRSLPELGASVVMETEHRSRADTSHSKPTRNDSKLCIMIKQQSSVIV